MAGISADQKKILSMLKNNRKNESLCDVVILLNGKRINAHRSVLAATSQYFLAMFTSGLVESRQKEVALMQLSDSVEDLINYSYTGELKITDENVEDLLADASCLLLDDVVEKCLQFKSQNEVDPDAGSRIGC